MRNDRRAGAVVPTRAETPRLYGTVRGLYVMPSDREAIPVDLPVGHATRDLAYEGEFARHTGQCSMSIRRFEGEGGGHAC